MLHFLSQLLEREWKDSIRAVVRDVLRKHGFAF